MIGATVEAIDALKILVAGIFGGGLAHLAAMAKVRADTSVAFKKVDLDSGTADRSVALQEMEAALRALSARNLVLEQQVVKQDERIDALELAALAAVSREQECLQALAYIRGEVASLKAGQPIITMPAGMQLTAAPAAPTEG